MSVGFVIPYDQGKNHRRKNVPHSNTCEGSGHNAKIERRLAARIRGWDAAVKARAVGDYTKPGSRKK